MHVLHGGVLKTETPDSLTPQEGEPREAAAGARIRVLLVDDEERYRTSLAQRLALRGFEIQHVSDGEAAIRTTRQWRPEVIILDRRMPGMQGEEVLREVKRIAPEVQVIMLTGPASMESAAVAGRLDVFAYLTKPCETDELVGTIRAATQERKHVMARHEIPEVPSRSLVGWLTGTHGWRPGVMMLGVAVFLLLLLMPTPASLLAVLSAAKSMYLSQVSRAGGSQRHNPPARPAPADS
ncbi:MAG: response regulator [Planctomycetota bacterium]